MRPSKTLLSYFALHYFMDWKVAVIAVGIVAAVAVAGFFFFANNEEGEQRHGTYGMDLTVEVENITNEKSEFRITISEKNGWGLHINKTVNVNAHSTGSFKIPVDWDGEYNKLVVLEVSRMGGKWVKDSFWIYSGEDQTKHMKPLG